MTSRDSRTFAAALLSTGLAIMLFRCGTQVSTGNDQSHAVMEAKGACPAPLTAYGNPLAADTLSNLRIGVDVAQMSYRFRSIRSDAVQSVRVYVKRGEGYSGGNGGTLRLDLVADDPKDHTPVNQVLASAFATDLLDGPFNRVFTFEKPIPLTGDLYYHLVFSNCAPEPDLDFVSINNLVVLGGGQSSLADPSVLTKGQLGSSWVLRADHIPIFALQYTNSGRLGQGYIDALSQSGVFHIKGTNQAREEIAISGEDIRITEANVRVRDPLSSPADLSVSIEDSKGNVLSVTRAQVGSGANYDWVKFALHAPLTLRSGETYDLVLSSEAGVDTFPLQGGARYGFDVPTLLRTGGYEVNTGAAWIAPRSELHLQYYFCR